MPTVARALCWSLCVAVCGACGAEPDPEPTPPRPEPELLARLRRLECVRNALCRASDDPTLQRVRNGLFAERLAIDPAALAECEGSGDRVVFDVRDDEPTSRTSPCVRLWTGLTGSGDTCDLDTACEPGLFCDRENDGRRSQIPEVAGACGVCAPQHGQGEPCDPPTSAGDQIQCQEGLYCNQGTCQQPPDWSPPMAAYGEPCGDGVSCMGELHCGAAPSTAYEPLCGPPSAEGEVCLYDTSCAPTLQCVVESFPLGTCVSTVLDGLCAPGPGCTEGLACIPKEPSSYSYWCKPLVARGDACADSAQCPTDHLCLDGRCGRLLAPEAACGEPPDQCAHGAECYSGSCRYLPVTGEPCVSACATVDCIEGLCTEPDLSTEVCNGTAVYDGCPELSEYCRIDGECEPICYLPG